MLIRVVYIRVCFPLNFIQVALVDFQTEQIGYRNYCDIYFQK